MTKKFAIVLALFLIAVVCSAGCIDPETPVDPVDPVVPVDPVDPVTPVDPVVPEEPVDPVVPAEGDFTVTFMMNSAVDDSVYLKVYVDEGETVAEPEVPGKPTAQYIFVKWTTDKENKNAYDFATPVTADLVLYADWDVMGVSSGSSHTHKYATGGQKGDQYGLFCSCGDFKPTGSVENAIQEAPAGATIDLTDVESSSSSPVSIDVGNKEVTIECGETPVQLTYAPDTEIKIKSENPDEVDVIIEEGNLEKKVIFDTDADGDYTTDSEGLLVPAAAVDEDDGVGDVYTGSGMAYLAGLINEEDDSSAASMQTDDPQLVLSYAPVGDAVSDSLVLCYEPAPTALGDAPKEWTITLMDDIDLSDEEWIPIGTITSPFKGTFDGQGHTISNLKVTGTNDDYVGFFGYVCGTPDGLPTSIDGVYTDNGISVDTTKYSTVIKNLNLVNVDVKGAVENTGALAGQVAYTYVYNVKVGHDGEKVDNRGSISGGKAVGGVIGKGVGSYIDSCVNYVSVVSTDSSLANRYHIGGIAGSLRATEDEFNGNSNILSIASNCQNYAAITADLTAGGAGGICGQTGGSPGLVIYNSVNNGAITVSASAESPAGDGSTVASGILGADTAGGGTPLVIAECTNSGSIYTTGSNELASLNGIVGYVNNAQIINCKFTGSIGGDGETDALALEVGGIVAHTTNSGGTLTISNPEVTGSVNNDFQGGIVAQYVATAPIHSVKLEDNHKYADCKLTFSGVTVQDISKLIPYEGCVVFENVKTTSPTTSIDLSGKEMIRVVIDTEDELQISIDASKLEENGQYLFSVDGATFTITGNTKKSATLWFQGDGITVINNADMPSVSIGVNGNSADVTIKANSGSISLNGSPDSKLTVSKEVVVNGMLRITSSDNAVIHNSGTIQGSTHSLGISDSEGVIIHNHGRIQTGAGKSSFVLYEYSNSAYTLLNYQGASLKSQEAWAYHAPAEDITVKRNIYSFGDGVYRGESVAIDGFFSVEEHVFNATKINSLSIKFDDEATDITEKVMVYANFESDYEPQLLEHSWLVDFKPKDITGTDTPVTVKFLGEEYTATVQAAENGGGESE